MNPLVPPGFSHYQDKLYIMINIDSDQYGKD